jgi:hypothetical protein
MCIQASHSEIRTPSESPAFYSVTIGSDFAIKSDTPILSAGVENTFFVKEGQEICLEISIGGLVTVFSKNFLPIYNFVRSLAVKIPLKFKNCILMREPSASLFPRKGLFQFFFLMLKIKLKLDRPLYKTVEVTVKDRFGILTLNACSQVFD